MPLGKRSRPARVARSRRRSQPSDIAIIGMACRLPGAATPEAFWTNLVQGVESIAFLSNDELRAAGVPPNVLGHPHYVKASPILESPAGFDAAFFDYSPAEARLMDPQHRLFLEVAWETFEDAGYDPLGDKGVVGVYAGAGGLVSSYMVHHDHPELRGQTGDLGHIGNDRDFLCSRVSFKLNLTGPSVNVQTACSTSLVAVHLACRSLCDGEADMALAGASVVRVPHLRGYLAEPGGIYSPDGHCRAFDAKGSGTLFGSGVAAVLLKPLAAALADGDRIYAIIRGSAIDNDGGMKLSYTASTVEAQARAMTEALARAQVLPDTIGYVECHGTATVLGDPLEIQALTRAFPAHTDRIGFCPIGSVKSNLGHLEQCAGLAGLLKATLALHHGAIPPSLHFETPNPRIPFERSPFFVNTALRPFKRGSAPRRAAVNSIGMGGTNAFVVIEEAPPPPKRARKPRPLVVLNLSAKTQEALAVHVANVRGALAAKDAPDIHDACLTANSGRHHFGHRFSAVGRDRAELLDQLDRFVASDGGQVGLEAKRRRRPIVFLFSGQGSQYAGMGDALYRGEAPVRDTLERCFALFKIAGIDLRKALFSDDETRLTRTFYAQPALFALEVGLTNLWAAWGIIPDTVVGHSVGEFAAAVAAGVFSLEDGVRLVAARARLMNDLSDGGGMVAVGTRADTVRTLWPDGAHDLAVAAENAADSTVVSGSKAALAPFVARCRRLDIPVTELKVSHAFHSPLVEPVLEPFGTVAGTVAFKAPRIRWISTLTGDEVKDPPPPLYWSDQLRQTVRFGAAVEAAARPGAIMLEIGPGAALITLGRRSVTHDAAWIPSMGTREDELRSVLGALRRLYLEGCTIRWKTFESSGARRISLPTYPFQHRDYWMRQPHGPELRAAEPHTADRVDRPHPLLGDRLGDGVRFESVLAVDQRPFLGDHRLFRRIVLPTTAALDTVMAAARNALGFARPLISDFVYERALVMPEDGAVVVQVTLEPQGDRAAFRLESTGLDSDDPWLLHASGVVEDAVAGEFAPFPSPAARARTVAVPPMSFYQSLAARGLSYGPAFRGIVDLSRGDDEAFARVALPPGVETDGYLLHPAFLDACLHVYAAMVRKYGTFDEAPRNESRIYVPVSVDRFNLYRTGVTRGWVHASLAEPRGEDEARLKLDLDVWDEDGRAVAMFRGLTIRETDESMFGPGESRDLGRLLYGVKWRDAPHTQPSGTLRSCWYIVAESSGIAKRLADALSAQKCERVVLVTPSTAAVEEMTDAMPDDAVGIVYLGALSAPSLRPTDSPPTPSTEALVCGRCVDLVRALDRVRGRLRTPPRLWLVTRGAQGDNGAPAVEVAQSPLWGLGRTLALEHPDLWGGLIDLPIDADDTAAADLLIRELTAASPEDQIIWRAGKRLAPRMTRIDADAVPLRPAALLEHATYWIAGGLGRLGLKVAEALVAAGARHLVLSGRHSADGRPRSALDTLRRSTDVVVMASDVTRVSDVQAVLSHIHRSMPPLKGVIHAAAVFEAAVLANVTEEQLRTVFAPKVAGAWLLHRETSELDLDFFVLFSSVLSVWGGAGQAAYTAANSFLDALATFRRANGLPAIVLNWGPWAGAALAERWGPSGTVLWKERGTAPLPLETCLAVLLRFLNGGPAQVLVSETRWPKFLAQFADVPPLYREMAEAVAHASNIAERTGPGGVLETVRRHASRILGLPNLVDVDQPLNELGLDSLLAVSLANRLRQALDITVPTAVLLKGSSVRALVAELFPDETPPTEPRPDERAAMHRGPTAAVAGRGWLIFPRANRQARTRLFCFPFAGGGAATFRPWVDRLHPSIELVAIEPPGRQTRIDEPPIRDMETFVADLVTELPPFLDKPFAVYGHCLGALTLFETVRALLRQQRRGPVHVFVSGARAPDELHRHQQFELNLLVRLCRLPDYDIFLPVHRQSDDVFAEALREFKVLATESFLSDPELRRLILPVIRAEFEMTSNYRYTPNGIFDVPITCLTGLHDTYVAPENAAAWKKFTTGRFQLITVETDHFLVVEDEEMLIDVVNRELTTPVSDRAGED